MTQRAGPGLTLSRDVLLERMRADQRAHLALAGDMAIAVMAERQDPALPALATWADVESELREAKVCQVLRDLLRRCPPSQSFTLRQWAGMVESARMTVYLPSWRAYQANKI